MLLRRLCRANLILDSGAIIEAERLGKGRYTEAWKTERNIVYLRVKTEEKSKEILESLTREKNIHLPKCSYVADDGDSDFRWYKMPLYFPLTAANRRAWSDFKTLKEIRELVMVADMSYDRNRMAIDINADFSNCVEESTLSPSIKAAVDALVNEACNYGEYLIEITKKNCAVDKSGNLILLDPLFDWEEVKRSHMKREAKVYQ